MTTKAVEAKSLYLRPAADGDSAELVVINGDSSCTVYRLRPQQLRRLAIDANKMALLKF